MGCSLEWLRPLPKLLLAHTPRVEWLDTGVRLYRALWDVDHVKILDRPCDSYYEELQTVGETDEVRAIADLHARHAQGIEPACKPILLDSAKHYVVPRRLLERQGCNGVAVRALLCTGAGTGGRLPACMALSKLLDGRPRQVAWVHAAYLIRPNLDVAGTVPARQLRSGLRCARAAKRRGGLWPIVDWERLLPQFLILAPSSCPAPMDSY